jgi:hypothetical protein
LTQDKATQDAIKEIDLQLHLISLVKKDIKAHGDEFNVIPSNIGISDAAINSYIAEYNKGCMDY